jgi:hypothetical protein
MLETDVNLPHRAFGWIGMGLVHKCESARKDEVGNVGHGMAAAENVGDGLYRSGTNYAGTENANVRSALQAMGWIRGADGNFHIGMPPPSQAKADAWQREMDRNVKDNAPLQSLWKDASKFFTQPRGLLVGSGIVSGSSFLWATEAGKVWESKFPEARTIGALNRSVMARYGLLTSDVFKMIRKLTLSAVIVEGVWESVRVPDDRVIDNALAAWSDAASKARDLFGTDVSGVLASLRTAWTGPAMSAADRKILDFLTAGFELANRAETRAKTLNDLVGHFNEIHKVITRVAIAALGTIIALTAAGTVFALGPWATAAKQLVVTQLSTWLTAVVALCAGAFVIGELGFLSGEGDKFASTPQKGVPERRFASA